MRDKTKEHARSRRKNIGADTVRNPRDAQYQGLDIHPFLQQR